MISYVELEESSDVVVLYSHELEGSSDVELIMGVSVNQLACARLDVDDEVSVTSVAALELIIVKELSSTPLVSGKLVGNSVSEVVVVGSSGGARVIVMTMVLGPSSGVV